MMPMLGGVLKKVCRGSCLKIRGVFGVFSIGLLRALICGRVWLRQVGQVGKRNGEKKY